MKNKKQCASWWLKRMGVQSISQKVQEKCANSFIDDIMEYTSKLDLTPTENSINLSLEQISSCLNIYAGLWLRKIISHSSPDETDPKDNSHRNMHGASDFILLYFGNEKGAKIMRDIRIITETSVTHVLENEGIITREARSR